MANRPSRYNHRTTRHLHGVNDPVYQMSLALDIIRRYLDRNAQYTPDKTGIAYSHFNAKREWLPALWSDGTPIKTHSGKPIVSPQYVRTQSIMSKEDAIKMLRELSEE